MTETDKIRIEIYKNMTPEEKLKQASNLYQAAWELKFAALKKDNPDLSDEVINDKVKEFFLYAST